MCPLTVSVEQEAAAIVRRVPVRSSYRPLTEINSYVFWRQAKKEKKGEKKREKKCFMNLEHKPVL